jgi:hypothetical protein
MKTKPVIVTPSSWLEVPTPVVGAKAYAKGACRVIVSLDPVRGRLLWHLSISCEHRYPTWDEIKDARYSLVPDNVTMAMLLPPRAEYVNVHPNCFHLHETEGDE